MFEALNLKIGCEYRRISDLQKPICIIYGSKIGNGGMRVVIDSVYKVKEQESILHPQLFIHRNGDLYVLQIISHRQQRRRDLQTSLIVLLRQLRNMKIGVERSIDNKMHKKRSIRMITLT